jgi:hypothetical protein
MTLSKCCGNDENLRFFLRKLQITPALFSHKIEVREMVWGKFVRWEKCKRCRAIITLWYEFMTTITQYSKYYKKRNASLWEASDRGYYPWCCS